MTGLTTVRPNRVRIRDSELSLLEGSINVVVCNWDAMTNYN